MSDSHIDIAYPVNSPDRYKIKSNVRKDMLSDILCDIVRLQTGSGKDKSISNKRKVYHIRIDLDLNYDDFRIKSDTGNKGLTLGIIMDIIGRIKK